MKKKFRDGQQAQAIADCEALCLREPANRAARRLCANMHALVKNYGRALELLQQLRQPGRPDADLLFNIALCERELHRFADAARTFTDYTQAFDSHPDGWAGLAECRWQLGEFEDGVRAADRAVALDAAMVPAWLARGRCLAALNRAAEALDSFDRALRVAPRLAELKAARGDALQQLGRLPEALADYRDALQLAPADGQTLKQATTLMLELGQGEQAIALCREILKAHPDSLTARLGAEWVLSQLVPLWHVPMMNEPERNQAYDAGLRAAVGPDDVVFEVGTGSGIVAMMAARAGARHVYTCEAVGLVAATARQIVERNGYQDRVSVIAKPSHAVQPGADLPAPADVLVHEIFSSELLGEHVLPALEDAKRRLLKPGGRVLPAAASIMVALVGGPVLGRNLHVAEAMGFDLRDFNAIQPRKRPLYREDLSPDLLSGDVEAFRFDFAGQDRFPAERKPLRLAATAAGLCYGLIQWIRIDMGHGIVFDNHPSRPKPVSNWQHTVYGFDEPLQLDAGAVVDIVATHDRARPWFRLA